MPVHNLSRRRIKIITVYKIDFFLEEKLESSCYLATKDLKHFLKGGKEERKNQNSSYKKI